MAHYINDECIAICTDVGACVEVCPSDAIHPLED